MTERKNRVEKRKPANAQRVRLGLLEGIVDPATLPDFFEPMDAEELALWEGRPSKAAGSSGSP